jgi:hypothetical protein
MKAAFAALLLLLAGCAVESVETLEEPKKPVEPKPVAVESPQQGKKEKKDGMRFEDAYLQRTWGIKGKRIVVEKDRQTVKVLLEFTKDVDNLGEMRQALMPNPRVANPNAVVYRYFDSDNVSMGGTGAIGLQGELTGKKGDAVWITLSCTGNQIEAVKLEVRPSETVKKKTETEKKGS